MSNPGPTVFCEKCGAPMPARTEIEAETLSVVSSEWTKTSLLQAGLPRIKREALCNRLKRLVDRGLVERRRIAGTNVIEWRLAPKPETT